MSGGNHAARRPVSEEALIRALRAMGHPHRLTIVRVLLCRAAACCTSERADDAVSIRPAATSGHLGELEDAGVIERARESRGLYSRVNRGTLGQLAALLTGSTHSEDGRAA